MTMEPSRYTVNETLPNGRQVCLRALRPDDCERMAEAFGKIDKESVYTRFFSYKKELTEADFQLIRGIDFDTRVALVMTLIEAGKEIIIASSSYVRSAPGKAEIAFIVEEDFHRQGIARRLLTHLGRIAREQGISVFEADVLAGNGAMLKLFASAGWPIETETEDGVVHVTMAIDQAV